MKLAWLGILSLALLCALGSCQDPIIIEEPSDVTVRQGDDVTLRCVVEHLPSDDLAPVQWTRANFALGHDRNLSIWDRYSMVGDISIGEYNLHIDNANVLEDESQYECQVTSYVLRTRKASVTVLVPPTGPKIEGKKVGDVTIVNVVVERENEIACKAFGGKPAATLQWYRNGIKISDDKVSIDITGPHKMLYNTTATLRITPQQSDADAAYACVMESDALPSDAIGRTMMKLNMLKPPIVSVSLPPSIREGDYVVAECKAVADPPVISYKWFVNGRAQTGETSSAFDVGVVNGTWHQSVIGCVARNDAGPSARNDAKMDVLYAPVFVNGSTHVTAEVGDSVTLWCDWDSNPKPSVYWLRKGDDVILGTDSKLNLNHVTQEMSGPYVCRANAGSIGDNWATTQLTVSGRPMIGSEPTQNAVLGEVASVECAIWSYPGIDEVTWSWLYKGVSFTLSDNETKTSSGDDVSGDVKYRGKFTSGDRSARLEIVGVNKDDLHTYSCSVTNSYGTESKEIVLEEDTSDADDVKLLATIVGIAVGVLLFIVVIVLVAVYCARSRRQRKSTNFDKERRVANEASVNLVGKNGEKLYSDDETVPGTHNQAIGGGDFHVRSSISSNGGAPDSSVTGSDDTNPTPTSGQDDGYHTEGFGNDVDFSPKSNHVVLAEANSWNRTDHSGKVSLGSTSPAKSTSGYPGYVVNLPPPMEMDEMEQPLYSTEYGSRYPLQAPFQEYPPRPMSANRYPYEHGPYDPTTLTNPVSTIRSVSALGERLSPPSAARYGHRKYSEVTAPPTSMYAPANGDYYANHVRSYTPMQSVAEPASTFGSQAYVGGNRTTPIPAALSGASQYYQVPVGSSQSSLDKFERESALSASAVAARAIDPYENASRMSNLSSRLSQSSRSSDFLRPLNARMATHV